VLLSHGTGVPHRAEKEMYVPYTTLILVDIDLIAACATKSLVTPVLLVMIRM